MKTIIAKHIKSELGTGLHPVTIHDMFYLRNASKEVQKIDGFVAIVVRFINKKKASHENLYIMDGDYRQKYFQKMMVDAGVVITLGKNPDKKDIVGRSLYVAIQEVHHVNDEKIIIEDGEPVIEYHIFKTMPLTEDRPKMTGDPENNNGIPMDQFVTYKNMSGPLIHESTGEFKVDTSSTDDQKTFEEENFGDMVDESPDTIPDFNI